MVDVRCHQQADFIARSRRLCERGTQRLNRKVGAMLFVARQSAEGLF